MHCVILCWVGSEEVSTELRIVDCVPDHSWSMINWFIHWRESSGHSRPLIAQNHGVHLESIKNKDAEF